MRMGLGKATRPVHPLRCLPATQLAALNHESLTNSSSVGLVLVPCGIGLSIWLIRVGIVPQEKRFNGLKLVRHVVSVAVPVSSLTVR